MTTNWAYTLLVAAIKSLAQEFDDFEPRWEDYLQHKRTAIDEALDDADEDMAERVRAVLLQTEHTALARRFREFALGHVEPSYFRSNETINWRNVIAPPSIEENDDGNGC